MFWLEENLILSNVLIRGESNFDDKYVEKSVQLVRVSSFRNDLLQNLYFSWTAKYDPFGGPDYMFCWKLLIVGFWCQVKYNKNSYRDLTPALS